jgi:HD-GYP domain-containing protein (c-di-GMP phosphodiesterase class II)
MSFGWMALRFGSDRKMPPSLAGRLAVHGRLPVPPRELEGALSQLLKRTDGPLCTFVTDALEGLGDHDGSQIIVQPILRAGELAGVLVAGDKTGPDPQVSSYETQLVEAAAGYIGAFLANAGLYADQQAMFLGTIGALTASIDAKDPYTCGHSERVAHMASRLALAAGLGEPQAARIHICGLVHDVGKIGVPEAVLCKPGRLTEEEFGLIKLHPEIGHRILKDIPELQDILPGVLHHHERWDGRGYPHSVAGDAIPLIARLLALADTFDAMSSTRSYRAAMPREKVLAEIARCAGSQFDPALCKVFVGLDLSTYDRMVCAHAEKYRPTQRLAISA